MRFSRFMMGVAAVAIATSPALAAELKEGLYRVSGTDSKSGAYTGQVRVTKQGEGYRLQGAYNLTSGKQSWSADGKVSGDQLKFSFRLYARGLVDIFSFGRKSRTIDAVYTLGENSATGLWTAKTEAGFKRSDTWTLLSPTIESVDPAKVLAGTTRANLTLVGKDLPSSSEVRPSDVSFTLDGAADAKLTVVSVGERTDDGTRLKLVVSVDKAARLGVRGVKLFAASKDGVLTVEPAEVQLALGGKGAAGLAGQSLKLTVPLADGILTLTGASKLFDPAGKEVTGDLTKGVEIKVAGVYSIQAEGEVSNTYNITGETKPENKPFNFWYFPFYERHSYSSSEPMNLYTDGGCYEKIDRVFGLTPNDSMKFDQSRHMDAAAWVTTSSRLFKMPTEPAEIAKYNPTTVKGFAYCYQRSTDGDKSWWGHCWGAVIGSSIHKAPKAKEVAVTSTETIAFSEEQMEGILSAYYSNHNVDGKFYVNSCPAGRPTDKTGEGCDRYAADLWKGLVEGIKKQGVPLASNLRAESTDEKDGDQVWNHVIWKFEAELKRAPNQEDPNVVEISIRVSATNDIFPSTEDKSPRRETWVFRLRTNNGAVVSYSNDNNFVSASHFAPSYLARITKSTSGDPGCENDVLAGPKIGIARMTEKFGFEKIQ